MAHFYALGYLPEFRARVYIPLASTEETDYLRTMALFLDFEQN
jgi:hypothetical protein